MTAQTLTQAGISNVRKWCDVLLPFVLTTISRVKPDAREDQSRDIREFVKIKRILEASLTIRSTSMGMSAPSTLPPSVWPLGSL